MRHISQEQWAQSVPARWAKVYKDWPDFDKLDILDKLLNLDPVTKEAVDSIIGNESWTTPCCGECLEYCDAIISFEVYPLDNEEIITYHMCESCITEAKEAF